MRFILIILCTIVTSGAIASNLRDSIGVENQNDKQLILHKVEPKETYYSIGRLYQISPKIIMDFNKSIPLQIGTIIKVPTQRTFLLPGNQTNQAISKTKPKENQPKENDQSVADSDILEYKVGPREYLYTIAKRFNTTVEEIKRLNNLKTNNLSIGQVLKIPKTKVDGTLITPVPEVVEVPVTNSADDNSAASESERPKIPTGRLGLSERTERGVALWIDDQNLDSTKMLALHRTAPVGTVIKVTNPMTDRTTFAKVVGKFTENASTKDVIIVLTKATADLLGALDKRFQVTIDYGIPNE